ncbi:thioesterase II family protein [Streptomyces sp. NPDC057428]|uniref:thioesterase II family protein n=1 Tax=unclassified Streptomyces TaxID=2593676 RepID=UPI0036C349C1
MAGKPHVVISGDPDTASLRVLLVPHSGAGAANARVLVPHLPPDWQLSAVRLPGRESRIREPVGDLPGLAADVAATARALAGTAPLLVVGVCAGAVIALEAVRTLQDSDPGLVAGLVTVSYWSVDHAPDTTRLLPDGDDTEELMAAVRGFGYVPQHVADDDMARIYLPLIVADMRAVQDYRSEPEPVLTSPLLVISGEDDPLCPPERVARWAPFAERSRQARIPGGHMLLVERPAELVGAIAANLDHFR